MGLTDFFWAAASKFFERFSKLWPRGGGVCSSLPSMVFVKAALPPSGVAEAGPGALGGRGGAAVGAGPMPPRRGGGTSPAAGRGQNRRPRMRRRRSASGLAISDLATLFLRMGGSGPVPSSAPVVYTELVEVADEVLDATLQRCADVFYCFPNPARILDVANRISVRSENNVLSFDY